MKMKATRTGVSSLKEVRLVVAVAPATIACVVGGMLLASVPTAWGRIGFKVDAEHITSRALHSGDYGDAPDGQNAGYPVPYDSVIGNFPTNYNTANSRFGQPGGHTVDTSMSWFALLVSPENGPRDLRDPDTVENFIDDDFDDGLVGGLCADGAPDPPFPDPLAVTLTFDVTVAANAPDVTRYINVLIDLNRDGVWMAPTAPGDPVEWVVVDFPVHVPPGRTQAVTVGPFDTPLSPWTAWSRVSLTREPVVGSFHDPSGTGWDGSGIFRSGEIEDHKLSNYLSYAAEAASASAQAEDSANAAAYAVDQANAAMIRMDNAAAAVADAASAAAASAAAASVSASAAASSSASASDSAQESEEDCDDADASASALTGRCAICPCAIACAAAGSYASSSSSACGSAEASANASADASAEASAAAGAAAASAASAAANASAWASAFASAHADASAGASAIAQASAQASAAASASASAAADALIAACAGDVEAAARAAAEASAQATAAASAVASAQASAWAIANAYAVAGAAAGASAGAAAEAHAYAAAAASAAASASGSASAAAEASASAEATAHAAAFAFAAVVAMCTGDCCDFDCDVDCDFDLDWCHDTYGDFCTQECCEGTYGVDVCTEDICEEMYGPPCSIECCTGEFGDRCVCEIEPTEPE